MNAKRAIDAYDRAVAELEKDEFDKAIAAFTEAIRLDPKYAEAYYNRGVAHTKKGELDKGIADFTEAIRLDPEYAEAYHCRGAAYTVMGEFDEAITDFTETIRLNPEHAVAYYNRGVVYANKGEFGQAIADFTESIRLDPKDPVTYGNLAWLLATCPDAKHRDGHKAVENATQACELTQWRDPDCLDTLAAAYAETGNFDAAVKWQTKALELAPKDEELEAKLRSRLELYQANKPYRKSR